MVCVGCVGPCVRGGVGLAGVRVKVARLGRVGRGDWEWRVVLGCGARCLDGLFLFGNVCES